MIEDYFDTALFFKQGYLKTRINKKQSDHLLKVLRNQSLVEGDGFYKSENFRAPLISKFESEKLIPSENPEAPQELLWISDSLKKHNFFKPLRDILGDFTQVCPMINHFRKGDGMVWHTDSLDATIITCCVYLTEDTFTFKDGGWLGIGKKVQDDFIILDKILPNHGVMVVINNLDPSNLHRVEPVHSKKERNTLLFQLGYSEHTSTIKRLKEVKNIKG